MAPKVRCRTTSLLTDPDQAVDFVAAHQGRRAGDRLRHLARRLQIHPQARRRHPRHARDRGDPRKAAEHASGHAWLVLGAAGAAGRHQPDMAARCPRPGAFRSRRSSAASATACARSTSTPIAAWRWPASSAASRRRTRAEFDPRKFLKPAMDAMRDLCRDRFERFGTAGNASKIKVIADGRDGQTLRRGQARPADRNRESGLSSKQETCHEQDRHAHQLARSRKARNATSPASFPTRRWAIGSPTTSPRTPT